MNILIYFLVLIYQQKQNNKKETIMKTNIEDNMKCSESQFPTILTPKQNQNGVVYLQQYFIKNSQNILEEVNKLGAIVFRNFDIKSSNQAISILKQLGLKNHDYEEASPIRKVIVGVQDSEKSKKVLNNDALFMLSTQDAEQNQTITFHNQLLQTQNYPDYRALYCQQPAIKGGETSLACTKQLYIYVSQKHPQFIKKLQQKKIRYIRTLPEKSKQGSHPNERGWKQIFKAQNRQEAEKRTKNKYEVKWLNNQHNECVLKSKGLKGVLETKKGQKLFANQIMFFFKKISWNKKDYGLCFGDDQQQLPMKILQDIYNYLDKNKVTFKWQKGDLLIINNLEVMTSRQPYEGQFRKVHTCLMKGKSQRRRVLHSVLNNGDEMPLVGIGTWQMEKQKCQEIVYTAIKNGYRVIDCAAVYGNQVEVGKGIKRAFKEKIVERKDLFVVSKLWNTFHRPEHVKLGFMKTLKDLDLEYLDLYLMHFPVSLKFVPIQERYPAQWIHDPKSPEPYLLEDPVPIVQTWKAMEKLIDEELVRNIGVSNFNVGLLREVIFASRIRPSVLQIELHPELTQKNLIRFARQQGIQITSYSTFGASSYVPLGMAKQSQPLYKHQLIKILGEKYKKSTHQIILRWAIQQGYTVIPKSSKQERIKQNFDIIEWKISVQDMKKIDELNKNKMFNDPARFSEKNWGTFYPIHD